MIGEKMVLNVDANQEKTRQLKNNICVKNRHPIVYLTDKIKTNL